MEATVFVLVVTGLLLALIIPGCRYLQLDRWQILAALPRRKTAGDSWQATNLTFYGLITATGICLGLLLALILLQAAGVSLVAACCVAMTTLLVCIPAAGGIARWVEKKPHTFTIGGAFFCGLGAVPLLILLWNNLLPLQGWPVMHPMVVLAAVSIGYVLGEGIGRLACISFGCCYGKPLKTCGPLTRRLFGRLAFVFDGATKKAVYASSFGGEKLVPVQGMTCVLYTLTSMLATWLFLGGRYGSAFLLCLTISQLWRVVSEFFRADFRGDSGFTAYQKMSLASLPFALFLVWLFPETASLPLPAIGHGLQVFASPGVMIGLQACWLVMVIRFGHSMVTTATVSFAVVRERI